MRSPCPTARRRASSPNSCPVAARKTGKRTGARTPATANGGRSAALWTRRPGSRPMPEYAEMLDGLKRSQGEILRGQREGFGNVAADLRRLLSQADEQFADLMRTLTDPAKEGPRLFSFEAVEPGFFDRPKWVAEKFRLTLRCGKSTGLRGEMRRIFACGRRKGRGLARRRRRLRLGAGRRLGSGWCRLARTACAAPRKGPGLWFRGARAGAEQAARVPLGGQAIRRGVLRFCAEPDLYVEWYGAKGVLPPKWGELPEFCLVEGDFRR